MGAGVGYFTFYRNSLFSVLSLYAYYALFNFYKEQRFMRLRHVWSSQTTNQTLYDVYGRIRE